MRSADGLALLREIAREYGAVEIVFDEGGNEWIVTSNLAHASSGKTLEEAIGALYDRLEARPRAV